MRQTVRKVSHFLATHPDVFVNDPAYQLATLRHAPEMSEVIWEVKRALEMGIAPIKSDLATTETYILHGEDERPLAIFKGNSYMREYAAYRLDHKRFANVPPTVVTTLCAPEFGGAQTGSCQLYVEDSIVAVELSWEDVGRFSPSSIRRMAQFDIRLLNEDRHTSNILIRNGVEAIPIDHGFALSPHLGKIDYVWKYWEQASTPFSDEEHAYISYLDPEKDRALLIEEMGLEEKAANRHYVSTMLLKLGALNGLCPDQLGGMLCKIRGIEADTKFEILIGRLLERNARDWTIFTKYVNEEIKVILEEYEANKHPNFPISR